MLVDLFEIELIQHFTRIPLLLNMLVGEPLLRMLVYFNISSAPLVPFLMTRASYLLYHFIS